MPEFPRVNSERQLTTQQPSFLAPSDTKAERLQAVAGASQQVQESVSKLAEAFSKAKTDTAELNLKIGTEDLLSRAENDPDYNSFENYKKENEKLYLQNIKGLNKPDPKLRLQKDLAEIKLKNIFNKKTIDLQRSNVAKFVDLETNNPSDGSLNRIESKLDEAARLGYYGLEEAEKKKQQARLDLGVNLINKDLFSAKTPQEVQAIRSDILSGVYDRLSGGIDAEKKAALLKLADQTDENVQKRIEAQNKDAIVRNRMDTIVGLSNGRMNFEDLDMTAIAEYDSEFSRVLTKVKDFMKDYDPKLSVEEQALSSAGLMTESQMVQMNQYARSVTDVFLKNDNEELSNFVLRELEKQGDGLTPSVKIAAFTNLAYLKSKLNNPQTEEDIKSGERFKAIKSAVRFLESSNPYLSASSIGDLIVRNFISGASTEEQVMDEANSILRSKVVDRYKAVSKLPSTPNKVVYGGTVEDIHSGINELQGEKYAKPKD